MINDLGLQVIYTEFNRMKTAVAMLETELAGLKRQKDLLIATQGPKQVHAVCYDLEKGGAVPMTSEQFYNKLLELTDAIRLVEDQLVIARSTFDESKRLIRRATTELKDEDRTLEVFQKSVMEGKTLTECAEEMMVSPQTVSYHRTKIYLILNSPDANGGN